MELTKRELEMIKDVAEELVASGDCWLAISGWSDIEFREARAYEPETELLIKLEAERNIEEGSKEADEFDSLFQEALGRYAKELLEEELQNDE